MMPPAQQKSGRKIRSRHNRKPRQAGKGVISQPGQNPEVSMEGFTDILNSIKESYAKWRMASINKRPKAAEQLIDKVNVWTFNVNRQLKRTYAEPRWISQKSRVSSF